MGVYGEDDNHFFPGVLKLLWQGQQRYQFGDNRNLYDAVSATNAAATHILAARALLAGISNPAARKGGRGSFFYLRWCARILLDFSPPSLGGSRR